MGRYNTKWTFIFLLLASPQALGYVPTVTSSGTPIRWKTPFKLNWVGNPINHSGILQTDFFEAVVKGLQRWESASSRAFSFDYWQGSDSAYYPPNSEFNGTSSIYFASNSPRDPHLSSNVLGMTQVWYNTDTGDILETDIALNDRDFHFTNNPKDTSGYGAGFSSYTSGKNNVYIQNVITHELGHSLGLSHTGGLQSSMLFMESPEQAHLGCDEHIAIHALYPTKDEAERGNLSGHVTSEDGTPIFGAHVQAISEKRGTVLASAITDRKGRYFFSALEPGYYFLLAEPFYAGPQALPSYYSSSNIAFCPSNGVFSRSFLFEPNHGLHLKKIAVQSSFTSEAPPFVVHCDKSGGAFIMARSFVKNSSPALDLEAENEVSSGGGLVDSFRTSKTKYYELKGITGHLEAYAMAYSLYSPVHASISLTNSSGEPIETKIIDPVFQGESGYIDRDSQLIANHLPLGDYILKVTSKQLLPSDYPAGPVSLDSVPFVIISATLNKDPLRLSSIPDNARCFNREEFPPYSSPPGLPPKMNHFQETQSEGGFCSSIRSSDAKKNQNQMPMGSILGWFLPWVLMGFASRFAIHLRGRSRPASL